ncbi:FBD-associated F-box protein At5g27750, partial [Arabidopsis lyrata subsp. lyrata]|uniref:FBD-associated F-box protein At5g27750 n=1 Tax=Arabidopsis lyrata subsp. lyrata TaxID=81972 RepID=UPI000A29E09D
YDELRKWNRRKDKVFLFLFKKKEKKKIDTSFYCLAFEARTLIDNPPENRIPDEEYEIVFINFIDRFLDFNPDSQRQKFKVDDSKHEILMFKDHNGTMINRGIRLLDAVSSTEYQEDDGIMYPYFEFMPLNLFTSKTSFSLKLSFSDLRDPDFVSMPCLKVMFLREIRWSGTMHLEKLVSGCPVLEDLTLVRYLDEDELVLALTVVRSGSLKTLYVPFAYGSYCRSRVPNTVLEIDARGLEHMTLKEKHFEKIIVKNLTCMFMIDLDFKFVVKYGSIFDPEDLSKTNEILGFLTGISRARHMIISKYGSSLVFFFFFFLVVVFVKKLKLNIILYRGS